MSGPRLLFVCLGNICRSPTAEGLMRALLVERGLEDAIEVDSAGVGAWHVGERADPRMRQAAANRGYRLDSRARQVSAEEISGWDLVIAMDESNLEDLEEMVAGPADNIRLLSDFLPPGSPRDVPDPYYVGGDGFDLVIDLLEVAGPRLLNTLLDD